MKRNKARKRLHFYYADFFEDIDVHGLSDTVALIYLAVIARQFDTQAPLPADIDDLGRALRRRWHGNAIKNAVEVLVQKRLLRREGETLWNKRVLDEIAAKQIYERDMAAKRAATKHVGQAELQLEAARGSLRQRAADRRIGAGTRLGTHAQTALLGIAKR